MQNSQQTSLDLNGPNLSYTTQPGATVFYQVAHTQEPYPHSLQRHIMVIQ